jgi:hypothetical protein
VNIDAHEGNAQQQKDRFRDEWLEHLAQRRHGDAEQHQCRYRPGALAADPGEPAHGQGGTIVVRLEIIQILLEFATGARPCNSYHTAQSHI